MITHKVAPTGIRERCRGRHRGRLRGRRVSNISRISRPVIHIGIRPRTGPGPATDAPDAQACPGLKGKDKDEIQEDLRQCMAQANTYAADAREKCSEKMTKDGKKFKCTECGETKRRKDRLQTHIYSKHLGGKSWICPRWCVCVC